MKLQEKYPVLGSSVDPANLSLTLKGLVPLIITLLAFKGIQVENTLLDGYIEAIVGVISGLTVLFGLIRKIYNKFQ